MLNEVAKHIQLPNGGKDFSLFLVLICNFFFKGLWPEEII